MHMLVSENVNVTCLYLFTCVMCLLDTFPYIQNYLSQGILKDTLICFRTHTVLIELQQIS